MHKCGKLWKYFFNEETQNPKNQRKNIFLMGIYSKTPQRLNSLLTDRSPEKEF